jgi:AraC-like DNA-binding protein
MFFEYAAEALNDNAFGLHLAQVTNPREAGLLFYVASAAKNVSEALALFERYFRIVNEAVRLKLNRAPEGVVVEFDFFRLSRHRVRQNAEFGIAVILKALREAAGRNISPTKAAFAGERNAGLREFERFYGCPVEFGASPDRLAFSNETLALPLVTGDRYLLKTLRPICDAAARERATPKGTLRDAVENEVQRLLPHGKAQREEVATALAMSTRTFSRRLAEEGTGFDEVVDEVRRSLALHYIKEPGLSFSQIAWLLGYEGPTSFNHAFKRWTGRPPSELRAEKPLTSAA